MIGSFLSGRLGNQFFQYAFARALRYARGEHDEMVINFENVVNLGSPEDGFEDSLKYFNILPYKTTRRNFFLTDTSLRQKYILLFMMVHRKFSKRNFTEGQILRLDSEGLFLSRGGGEFIGKIPHTNTVITKGRFESPFYFNNISEILKKEFTPKWPVRDSNFSLYEKICNTNSVCVTIRRGDYVTDKNNFHNFYICDKKYFDQAISIIKEKLENPTFFFFSDDIEWAKENISVDCPHYYESGVDPVWEKIRLMYSCKHFIISNSTFSWWAQYLSRNPNKIVVSPNRWFANKQWKFNLISDDFIKVPI